MPRTFGNSQCASITDCTSAEERSATACRRTRWLPRSERGSDNDANRHPNSRASSVLHADGPRRLQRDPRHAFAQSFEYRFPFHGEDLRLMKGAFEVTVGRLMFDVDRGLISAFLRFLRLDA